MKHAQRFFLPLLLMLVAGCASIGTAPAQTFNQKMAYAIGTHTAVLQATTAAVTAGQLSSSDAGAILTQADNARAVLDTANAAYAVGNTADASNKLAEATVVLTALQSYLNAHGGK